MPPPYSCGTRRQSDTSTSSPSSVWKVDPLKAIPYPISSSSMAPVAVSSASVSSEGLLSTRLKVSSASSNWSSSRATVTVFSVSPMAKFSVPLAAVKSTSLVAAVVDPSSAVDQSTEAACSMLA